MRHGIGLLSPCGWGNLGDAAIQDAIIHQIRERASDATIIAFTQNPRDTTARHGIPAYPISGWSRPRYGIAPGADGGASTPTRRAVERLRAIRGLGRLVYWAAGLAAEGHHIGTTWRILRGLRLLVVSGGGQLDELWGGPWGHPYVLWKWAVLCRLSGTRMAFLSVGFGVLDSRLGRFFVRHALAMASVRSCRDQRTHELVGRLGIRGEHPVVPDLAFSYPLAASSPAASHTRTPLTVGIGAIIYRHPDLWPVTDAERYERYIQTLAAFTTRLLRGGCRVHFFTTARGDRSAVADIRERIRAESGASLEGQVLEVPTDTVAGCLAQLRLVDCAVASRLHSVILSQLAGKPVLALSYDWKVAQLMEEAGQSDYCLDIDGADVGTISERFDRMTAERARIAAALHSAVTAWRAAVRAQGDRVFGRPP